MSGLFDLILAVLGPLVAILADRLTVGSDQSFVEHGCKRVVDEHNQNVEAADRLSEAGRTLMVKTAQSSVAAVNLLPSLVAGVTSVYATVFGLLRGDGQAQAIMMAITIMVILLLSLRPLRYLTTYSLYNLHNLAKEEIPRRRRGDPNYVPPTHLRRVQQVPQRINAALMALALTAFLWRNSGEISGMLMISDLIKAVCGC